MLTQQQAYVRNFRVVLPKSWSVPACQPGRKVSSGLGSAGAPHPDITVSSRPNFHSGFPADAPWTEQHSGCGQSGRGIKVPTDFLSFDDSLADEKVTLSGGRRRFYKDTWELRRKGKNTPHTLKK